MSLTLQARPTEDEMFAALIGRDTSLDGVFVAAIRTTGIFCRPGCGAKKPLRENVEFFASPREAMHAGYRACKRCRPLDLGGSRPEWVERVIESLEKSADRRVSADDLRAMGVAPEKASRWFKANYGMTFQAFCRARRMGEAMKMIREGTSVGRAAAKTGYESESGFREAFEEVFGAAPGKTRARAKSATGNGGQGEAPRELLACWIETPLGPMLAAASDSGVSLLEFVDSRALATQIATLRRRVVGVVRPGTNAHLDQLKKELEAYFAGKRSTFASALEAPGTEFQARVWDALRAIPSGETRSYLDIAKQIGRPTATRAVARANGDNRLAILIPCHRVIGSDGTLTGYGGGVWRKDWLLEHERAMAGRPLAGLFAAAR
jgi:AraC family transcriptional regulator of adaptative response/methylated-DNA-[protein]-cysteine methyltransferase